MNSSTKFFAGAAALALLGQGCIPPTPAPEQTPDVMEEDAMHNDDAMHDGDDAMMEGDAMHDGDDAMMGDDKMMGDDAMHDGDDAMMEGDKAAGDEGAMMGDDAMMHMSSTYAPFTKEAYDAARAEHKPVLLFFYANWCPYCKEQDPRFAKVIPEHEGGVVALRVNYNDTDTDADEKALAQEFGVAYQHTMFFIGKDGETKKKAIGTLTDDQTREYLDLISS